MTSPVRRLRVRKAAGWKTSRRQDGRWKGKASGLPVAFRVSGGGRRSARGRSSSRCSAAAGTNLFTTQIADAPLPRAKIAPDGSFVFAGVVSKHASFVHGRIQAAARRARRASRSACASAARISRRSEGSGRPYRCAMCSRRRPRPCGPPSRGASSRRAAIRSSVSPSRVTARLRTGPRRPAAGRPPPTPALRRCGRLPPRSRSPRARSAARRGTGIWTPRLSSSWTSTADVGAQAGAELDAAGSAAGRPPS